jgi:hypothetical protein
MQAYKRPPTQGLVWVSRGFALWKRNPGFFAYLTFGYFLTAMSVASLPFLGIAVALVLLPSLSLGVLNGALLVQEKQGARPEVLFAGYKSNTRGLLGIGAASLATNVLVLVIAAVLFDSNLLSAIMAPEPASTEPGLPAGFIEDVMLHHVLTLPLAMATFFAPALAGWQGISAPKAMFFSIVACWRNFLPFCSYSVAAFFIVVMAPMFVGTLVAAASPFIAQVAVVAAMLSALSVLFASFLPITLDVFGHDLPGHEV